MNVVKTRQHIGKLYENISKIITKELTKILLPLQEDYYEIALAMGYDGELQDLDESFLEAVFSAYNPVTKYVFYNELDRKESRLFEALVASTLERTKSYQTAERLLTRQVKQSVIDLEDEVAKTVYEDLGVTKVRWVTEQDEKTCGVCQEMDGQIYDLEDVPPKQHYNCRCYLIPVRVK